MSRTLNLSVCLPKIAIHTFDPKQTFPNRATTTGTASLLTDDPPEIQWQVSQSSSHRSRPLSD